MGKRVYPRTIVEEAPSHDGRPCYGAWEMIETDPDTQSPPDASNRPKWSIQIYDTLPAGGDREKAKITAKQIEESSRRERARHQVPSRIEVHSFPLPSDTPDAERVALCMAHHRAEVAKRNASGTADFFIPPKFDPVWEHQIIIIHRGPYKNTRGAFLQVFFGMKPSAAAKAPGRPDYEVTRYMRKCLPDKLFSFTSSIEWFYESYVGNGTIHSDLERWRRDAEQ